MTGTADFRNTPPLKSIVVLGASIFIGLGFSSAVMLADVYFVGRLGAGPLEALGFAIPLMSLLYGLSTALGVGVRSHMAIEAGRGAGGVAEPLTAGALFGFLAFGVLGALGALVDEAIFLRMGADAETAHSAGTFLSPIWLTAPFLGVALVLISTFQGLGKVMKALQLAITPPALTLALDPLLIFGWGPVPALGIYGAGIASGIPWVCAATWGLFMARREFALSGAARRRFGAVLRPILAITIPTIASRLVVPLFLMALSSATAAIGPLAVSALAVVLRLSESVGMGPVAVGFATHSVAGFFHGAGDNAGERASVTASLVLCAAWGLGWWLIFTTLAGPIAAAVVGDPKIAELVASYLYLGAGEILFGGLVVSAMASLVAVSRPREGFLLNAITTWCLVLPVTLLAMHWSGWLGLVHGLLVGRVIAAVASIAWLWRRGLISRQSQRGRGRGLSEGDERVGAG